MTLLALAWSEYLKAKEPATDERCAAELLECLQRGGAFAARARGLLSARQAEKIHAIFWEREARRKENAAFRCPDTRHTLSERRSFPSFLVDENHQIFTLVPAPRAWCR